MSSYIPFPAGLAAAATKVGSWCTALAMAAGRKEVLIAWKCSPHLFHSPHLSTSLPPTVCCDLALLPFPTAFRHVLFSQVGLGLESDVAAIKQMGWRPMLLASIIFVYLVPELHVIRGRKREAACDCLLHLQKPL